VDSAPLYIVANSNCYTLKADRPDYLKVVFHMWELTQQLEPFGRGFCGLMGLKDLKCRHGLAGYWTLSHKIEKRELLKMKRDGS
jgi:hypothetical protein